MFVVKRSSHNPFIIPAREHPWEASATFNWSAAKKDNETHVVYRAMSLPELLADHKVNLSSIGHAVSTDGEHFKNRRQFIAPEHEWEQFGCEDPRVTFFEGHYYIFYTALGNFPFSAEDIKVACAVTDDFDTVKERHLVTPFNAKAAALFPERVNGKIALILTVNTDRPPAKIAIALFDSIEEAWDQKRWNKWYADLQMHTIDDPRRSELDHIEVGAAPIKTEDGWLLLYSHIQNYFADEGTIFGIESLLLDSDNPKKVVGRSSGPMLTPVTLYEKHGNVPNIVFPSGALEENGNLNIYYGSADTTCCRASVNLKNLLVAIQPEKSARLISRAAKNPIITPNKDNEWEAKATFNPGAIYLGDRTHILYRAMGEDNTSTIGYATSKDGITIDERLDEPIYTPRADFELKKSPGNSGCEDPRIVQLDEKLYMFYTAANAVDTPRVAVSTIDVNSFLAREWEWSPPIVITPPGIMDKDTALIPEKVRGKYMFLHRISDTICIDTLDTLDFESEKVTKCVQLFGPRAGMWDDKKVGIAGPPFKCEKGWIMFYHGVSHNTTYRVGAVLLDADDPSHTLSRTTVPILEPKEDYEVNGQVPNVVFPCGNVVRDGIVYIYYGGGDSVVGVATMQLDDLIDILTTHA